MSLGEVIVELKPEDLYDGVVCQSLINRDCIYKLNLIGDKWFYLVIAEYHISINEFIKCDGKSTLPLYVIDDFVITKNSILFDKISLREYKLNQLGIK